jgi:hypothetical protein
MKFERLFALTLSRLLLSPISDNVLLSQFVMILSISEILFAVLLALSIANDNSSFIAFLALIASVSVLTVF